MSVQVFFAFSTGLEVPIIAPIGTLAGINQHVADIEAALGIKRTTCGEGEDASIIWDHWDEEYRRGFPSVEDKLLCEAIEKHNDWVRWIYRRFSEWAETPVAGGETITPDDAKQFWCGLTILRIRPERWTKDYYRSRMEHCFEVLRGRESEGESFDAKALTPAQAGGVIHLFEQFLDPGDARLECPKGHDHLADSDEYDWCEKCGAVDPADADHCRRRKCPVLANRDEDA